MPVIITREFNLKDVKFSEFISDYHGAVIQRIQKFHRKIGVIGFEIPDQQQQPWQWSTICVTNQMLKSIEIVTSLKKLWIFGYRCAVVDGVNTNPWMLVDDYKGPGFSGLGGPIKTLMFDGKYRDFVETLNVSKASFDNSITVLYNHAEKLMNNKTPNHTEIEKAQRSFLIMVLYFAESLRILPVRSKIEEGFDSEMPVSIGRINFTLARNWGTISYAFLKGEYSTTEQYEISNEEKARDILLLLLCSRGNRYVLDGIPPEELQGPGAGGN